MGRDSRMLLIVFSLLSLELEPSKLSKTLWEIGQMDHQKLAEHWYFSVTFLCVFGTDVVFLVMGNLVSMSDTS